MLPINNVKVDFTYLGFRCFFLVLYALFGEFLPFLPETETNGNCQRLFLIYANNCDCDPPFISRNLSWRRTLGYTEWFIIGVPYPILLKKVFVSTSFIRCTKYSLKIVLKQNLIPLYDQANSNPQVC